MRNAVAVVVYDIADNKVRARFHRLLREYGVNTQLSVFECEIDDKVLAIIRTHVEQHLDPETDSVRIYHVCGECVKKIKTRGQGASLVTLGYMVV